MKDSFFSPFIAAILMSSNKMVVEGDKKKGREEVKVKSDRVEGEVVFMQ